jgi:hypothetical protein
MSDCRQAPNPTTLMRVGMTFLIAGMISLHYLTRWLNVPPDVADGVGGLFYGLAIASLLMSVRARVAR